jgi:hypothetical protein
MGAVTAKEKQIVSVLECFESSQSILQKSMNDNSTPEKDTNSG